MIRGLVGWFRLVLPPRWALGLFLLFISFNEAAYLWIHVWLQAPQLDPDRLAMRDRGLVFACAAFGGFRVLAFHPLYRTSYRRWLELTPWTIDKPLPVGPIHIAPQDVCCFTALLLLHQPQLSLWRFPLVFLFVHSLMLCFSFFPLGLAWTGYAVAFGLGLVVRLWHDPALASAVAAIVYCIAYAGLRRSLVRFPWTFDAAWREAATQGSASVQPQTLQTLGWPFDQLLPAHEPAISIVHGAALSLLTGWWGYSLLSLINLPPMREVMAAMFVIGVGYMVPFLRLIIYIGMFRSPISFWGRIWTLRWVIPGYDVVFVVPVLAIVVADQARRVLETAGVAAEIRCSISVVVAMLLALNLGPTFHKWRLTGRHRISPGRPNKQLHIRL